VKIGFDLPPVKQTKNLNRSQHLDLMLNDWGIHHLHISTKVGSDGFVQRDGPLIFAIFKPDRAYLIDVGDHKSWVEENFIRVVVETWPDEGLLMEIKGILGARQSWQDSERSKLRAAGITSMVTIGNRVFVPTGGISTAGTSSKASVHAMGIMKTLRRFEEQVQADPTAILETIRQHGGHPADVPEFEFSVFQEGFGVIEKTSGFPIRLQ
jgi:hypothetical protein